MCRIAESGKGADGRRQITDFLLPGDFFGFARGVEHHFSVVEATIERHRCGPLHAPLPREAFRH
jgi:CRP-like cAMP-binding protein